MRIEIPRETERLGAVLIHSTQKVFELDSGLSHDQDSQETESVIQRIPYDALYEIEKQMAIVVPMRNERLKLVEGVLCGIPHQCLTIIVSNSPREPVDRFAIEQEAFENFSRFIQKDVLVLHQKDPVLAEACREAGYDHILDAETGLIKSGKAEGMILGTLLARISGRKYVGFIDADNYFPGAVQEYIREYAAGFLMSKSPYTMVRIAWHSKPKIVRDSLFFAKWGRTSRRTNEFLNRLIAEYTGFETEIIKTGNAGEHALTMELAMLMDYSSGYSIEPYHYINLFEKFGGLPGSALAQEMARQHVEIFQIESRNPHMHDVKGNEHIDEMTYSAMQVIYQSAICPDGLKQLLGREIEQLKQRNQEQVWPEISIYPALADVNLDRFRQVVEVHPFAQALAGV
ncbi:MAG: mannosyl-3-phosphoglycerate synthase [Chloroflexi bacterium]|nr:MAG: mannosyl-3-phosphoglycerate synthase [Chloroflexota bacterium]